MRIAWSEIHREKIAYSVEDAGWFPHEDVEVFADMSAQVVLHRKDDDTVVLSGNLVIPASCVCGRCGIPVQKTITEQFEYRILVQKDQTEMLKELECSETDCTTLHIDEPFIDIDEILYEQSILAIPGKVLCVEECKGGCPQCGIDLNRFSCQCRDDMDEEHSPFTVLKALRK